MTIRKAVSVIQTVLQPTIYEMQKRHDPVANELDKAWIVVREIALKTENSLSDEGTTTAWMNMPESPNDDYTGELTRRVEVCEVALELLNDRIDAIVEKLPKEWGK